MPGIYIFCDESNDKGPIFSNFYGGLLIRGEHLNEVRGTFEAFKQTNNLTREMKWNKVSKAYQTHYIDIMRTLFDFVAQDKVKARIIYTQNTRMPQSVLMHEPEYRFTKLYYQFIKHAFGLRHCNGRHAETVDVKIAFDNLPINSAQKARFKNYICGLVHQPEFADSNITIRRQHISEYDSKDEVLGQVLDVLLGSMYFRLNKLHEVKNPETNRKGEKTKAKLAVYKYIQSRINQIRPGFNIGATTGKDGTTRNYWNHPYRHWNFIPYDREIASDD